MSEYLNVLLAVDIHVDQRAETDQTFPHFHKLLPEIRMRIKVLAHFQHTFNLRLLINLIS